MTSKNNYEIYYQHQNTPYKLAVAYILLTLFLSIFGPAKYFGNSYKYGRVIIFIFLVILFFSFGYYIGKYSKPKKYYYKNNNILKNEMRILRLSLIISFITLILEIAYLIYIGHFNLRISNLGELYISKIENNSNLIMYIRFLCSIFRVISNSLGIYRFNKLSKNMKKMIIFNITLYLMVFLFGYGNQKGVSDIVIYCVIPLLISKLKNNHKKLKKNILILSILFSMLLLFSFMQYLRYEPRGINAYNYHLFSTGDFYYDTNNIIFKIFGDKIGFGMSSILSGYLSQGYYGLSLCLQLPFEWTYGVGNSYAIIKLLEKIGIDGIYEKSYLFRMTENFGRDGLSAWNTIYPWLASDFTWLGALLFFIFVGYCLSKSRKEVIINDNIISYLMFVSMSILILFSPANNQLFHGYDSFISSWIIILRWLFFRGRFMYESKIT